MLTNEFKGLKLSRLGFGTMYLPVRDGNASDIDEKQVDEMVDYAIAGGKVYNLQKLDIPMLIAAYFSFLLTICEYSSLAKSLYPQSFSKICALGQRSRSDVADALRDCAPYVRMIGDAVRVSAITNAVYWGYYAALDI